jgi:xylulokinase
MLPKLLWLRRHETELFNRAEKFLFAHDYLVYRMCGAQVTDYSLASGSLLLDIHSLAWNEELLAAFDISALRLPDLAWAGTVAGELSDDCAQLLGCQGGIPIVVGGQDQKCAALGAAIRPGVAAVSLGTAAAISCLTEKPVLDPQRRIPAFPFVVQGFWVLEGVVGAAGAALRWARDAFFPSEDYPALDEWAGRARLGASGVHFYPHLAGATSPIWDAGVRGAFTGLSLATGKAEIVRSIL